MRLEKLKIDKIIPYEKNPRINDNAVDAVAQSIEQCDYMQPIVVDEGYVVLAGHTRLKALKQLGAEEADVLVVSGLDDKTKRKYRYLDNKTGEFAFWDVKKLTDEIGGLDFGKLDFFNVKNESFEFELGEARIPVGSIEYEKEQFGDERFQYKCPCCGFTFNA